jgi:hypothetical protein
VRLQEECSFEFKIVTTNIKKLHDERARRERLIEGMIIKKIDIMNQRFIMMNNAIISGG